MAAADPPHLTIPRVPHPPRLDDWLARDQPEAVTGMRRVEGFIQRFPNDGEPATERTIVYIGYDRQNLYVIAVPFRTLRFPSTKVQHWGLFFYRGIPRKGEVLYWPACSTRIAARFPQAAIVEGVEEVSPGRNLAVAPYAAARTFKIPRSAGEDTDGAIGLDAKAVIRVANRTGGLP